MPGRRRLRFRPSAPARALGAAGALFLGLSSAADAAVWHVDAVVDLSGNGSSRENAWKTLAAIDQAALNPGDVVLIHSGTYNERLTLTKSGTAAGGRITYKGDPGGKTPPVVRGIDGTGHHHIAVIGLEFTHLSTAHAYPAIQLANSNGWLIQDNYIHRTYGGGVSGAFDTVNSENIIRANTFDDIASIDGGRTTASVISLYGDLNLIEYNTIRKSLDRTRAFGRANVIRNNFFGATDAALYPNTSPFPHHTDSFQSYNSSRLLTQLLYERNWDEDNKDSVAGTNAHGFLIQDSGAGMNWAIARFNVLVRPGGTAYQFRAFDRFYGYNLTSIAVQNGAPNLFRNAVTFDSGPRGGGDLHDWRNNTWSHSPRSIDSSGIISTNNRPTNFTSGYQHAFNDSGAQGVLPVAPTNLPAVNPRFTDLAADDYTLSAQSPLRGAGGPLAAAVGAGTNATTLTVSDARRFFDGWGIADADVIRIGTGAFVRIAGIDYTTNAITLAAPRSWSSGAPVIVKGMEDIGALPHDYAVPIVVTNTTPVTLPAGPVTLTAEVGNPDAVRMVEFLVDGLPVGIDYEPPYAVAWTSDGTLRNVEARAYSAWAGRTLWRRQINTAPRLTQQPTGQAVRPDAAVVFSIAATAPTPITYRWFKDGVPVVNGDHISGATTPTLTLTQVTGADSGAYTAVAANAVDATESLPATLLVNTARIVNLSVRSTAGADAQTLIVGFNISGSGTKTILLRGIGPTLAEFGVTNPAADPELALYRHPEIFLQSNLNWRGTAALASAFAQVGAFPLLPTSLDSALLAQLPSGAYTTHLLASTGTGIALVEAYDNDVGHPTTRFSNVSVRSFVGTGDEVLIVGLVIAGSNPAQVVIRGIGPRLADFGVNDFLVDPELRVFNAAAIEIAVNNDWGGSAATAAAFDSIGAFALPPNSRDAALTLSLPPGNYTAQVSGVGNTTGVALLEVYEFL